MTCSICNGKGYVEIDSGGVTPWSAEIVDYDFCVCNPRCQCKNPVTYQMLSNGEVCYTCGLRLPSASPDVYELVSRSRLTPRAAELANRSAKSKLSQAESVLREAGYTIIPPIR